MSDFNIHYPIAKPEPKNYPYTDECMVPLQNVIAELLNRLVQSTKECHDYKRWLDETEKLYFEVMHERDINSQIAQEACRMLMSVYPNHSAEAIMELIKDRLSSD
jgi:UDP-N-acetylglucosamine pyrophosphorylase